MGNAVADGETGFQRVPMNFPQGQSASMQMDPDLAN